MPLQTVVQLSPALPMYHPAIACGTQALAINMTQIKAVAALGGN